MRAADCDTPGCTDRMVGSDDEDLLRSIRRHVDAVHPQDHYTDEQLRDWMGTAAFTTSEPLPQTLKYEDVPREADERTTLTAFLDWQRATLARKCEGLTAEQLRIRSAPPSTLSLLGLVRHLADVERWWFRINLAGEKIDARYSSKSDPDGEFDNVDTADADEALAAWREECERSRQIVAARSLDETGRNRDTGRVMTLRWTLVHLVEEYSRHNGHADLLRERIDGAVGY